MANQLPLDSQRYNLDPFEAQFRSYARAVIKLSPITIKNYLSDYRFFIQWLSAHHPDLSIEQAQTEHIQAYRTYLEAQDLPRASVNRRLSALRTIFTFLLDQQIIMESPMRGISNLTAHSLTHTNSSPFKGLIDEYMRDLGILSMTSTSYSSRRLHLEEFFSIINS